MFWSAIFALLTGLPGSGGPAVEQLRGESDHPTPRVRLAVDLGAGAAATARPLSASIAAAASIAPTTNSAVALRQAGHGWSGEGQFRSAAVAPVKPTPAVFASRPDYQKIGHIQGCFQLPVVDPAQAGVDSSQSRRHSRGFHQASIPVVAGSGSQAGAHQSPYLYYGRMGRIAQPGSAAVFFQAFTRSVSGTRDSTDPVLMIGAQHRDRRFAAVLREKLSHPGAHAAHPRSTQAGDYAQSIDSITYGEEGTPASGMARIASLIDQPGSGCPAAAQPCDAALVGTVKRRCAGWHLLTVDPGALAGRQLVAIESRGHTETGARSARASAVWWDSRPEQGQGFSVPRLWSC